MPRLHPPDKTTILGLAPSIGLGIDDVVVPVGQVQLAAAWDDLRRHRHLGFDTESKPTFVKGEESHGPDVVQFATSSTAYVFQLRHAECEALVRMVLTSPAHIKVGFGLQQDQAQLRRRWALEVRPLLDLDHVFHLLGYARSIGVKAAVAIVFGQRFVKSKRVTTTNWASPRLDTRQLLYAANDAFTALRVWQAMKLDDRDVIV